MAALLVLAVAAPALSAVAAAVGPGRQVDAVRVGALVSAGCWFVRLVDASLVSVSRLHSLPVAAAAGCGAALVVATVDAGALHRPALAGAALAAASVAVAAGRTATDGAGLLVAMAATTALVTVAGRPSVRVWGTAAVGLAAVAAGVVALRSAANSWQLPLADAAASHRTAGVLIVLGAAVVVIAGAQRTRGPAAVLVPVGAFVAVQAAPIVHRAD